MRAPRYMHRRHHRAVRAFANARTPASRAAALADVRAAVRAIVVRVMGAQP